MVDEESAVEGVAGLEAERGLQKMTGAIEIDRMAVGGMDGRSRCRGQAVRCARAAIGRWANSQVGVKYSVREETPSIERSFANLTLEITKGFQTFSQF